MRLTSVTVGIPVTDLAAAAAWYRRLLYARAEIEPADGIHEFDVLPGCWLQLSEGKTSGPEHLFQIGVEDLEAARRRLLSLGIAVAEPERVNGVIAFCDFADPDGNRLSLYEVLV